MQTSFGAGKQLMTETNQRIINRVQGLLAMAVVSHDRMMFLSKLVALMECRDENQSYKLTHPMDNDSDSGAVRRRMWRQPQ
jgi:hypothetical protein